MTDFLTWLTGLDEGRLTELLGRRPDVLRGTPAPDLEAVESRLRHEHGIVRSLLRQPRPALDVLSALIVRGGSATVDHLAASLDGAGADRHAASVLTWLEQLERDGLAWRDTADVAHTAPLVDTVLPVPADWGLPAQALLEPLPRIALDPMLTAWGIQRPTTKAAALTALLEAFADPVRLTAQIERLTPSQRQLLARAGWAGTPAPPTIPPTPNAWTPSGWDSRPGYSSPRTRTRPSTPRSRRRFCGPCAATDSRSPPRHRP